MLKKIIVILVGASMVMSSAMAATAAESVESASDSAAESADTATVGDDVEIKKALEDAISHFVLILPTPKLLFAYGEQRELKQKIVKLLQIDHWQRITLAVNNQAVQILRNRQQPVFVLL